MAKKPERNADDAELLKQAFQDVTPLPGRTINHAINRTVPTPPTPKISKQSGTRERHAHPISSRADAQLPEIRHGDAPGLDKRSAQRLKRGQMEIEARLDLHGLRQEEAHRALTSFIAGAHSAGKRCVLVITGKGQVSEGGGVLRTIVPRWLNQAPNRTRVLSFTHATPTDGGTGAIYVLLKRQRP
ncbi:MAG: hypothetical protein CBD27_07095 [Rhodospirillaceae bacterium TMED167]|nr:hypothetical protein [Rhodospirillaceae bacterium]OUW27089.1 MAG: hypothetical protein CBD27_07095 [Rhodospirillaceae bacterium TMED167]